MVRKYPFQLPCLILIISEIDEEPHRAPQSSNGDRVQVTPLPFSNYSLGDRQELIGGPIEPRNPFDKRESQQFDV